MVVRANTSRAELAESDILSSREYFAWTLSSILIFSIRLSTRMVADSRLQIISWNLSHTFDGPVQISLFQLLFSKNSLANTDASSHNSSRTPVTPITAWSAR